MNTLTSQRTLGRTGLAVSPLGLAALSFARTDTPRSASLRPRDVERAYHELGVNTFLVHYLMPTLAEGVRALIRQGLRDKLVLVSEVSAPWRGRVQRALETHLRKLGTDRWDVWLFGWVRRSWNVRPAVWQTMLQLKHEGRVRAIGFSSHDRVLAAQLASRLDPDVLMLRYNAAHRGAEREIFPTLPTDAAHKPGVIAYTATRWGMLLRPLPERGFNTAMTAPECYQFALRHPAVDMVWCAARNYSELAQDVAMVDASDLSEARYGELCRFGDAVHSAAVGGRRWMFGKRSD